MILSDGNIALETCKEEKDLGITFDYSLKFQNHINSTISKSI